MSLPRVPFRMWSQLIERGQVEALEAVRDTNRLLRSAEVRRFLGQPIDRSTLTATAVMMMERFDRVQRHRL